MKKLICVILAILMTASVLFVTGCGNNNGTSGGAKDDNTKLKLGMGVYSYYEQATGATEDANGKGQVVSTVAAVLVDANGKIVKCDLDTADNTVEFTAEGKTVSKTDFKTKREQGDSYGMKQYAGSAKEWYEQADAFEALAVGKTAAEVKALVAAEGKGNADVISAGCTIAVSDFAKAIEKAVKNAKESNAVAANTLKVGAATEVTYKDATEEAQGSIELETSFVASAVGADGKVVATVSDCLGTTFTFDEVGTPLTNTQTPLSTKLELGDSYGMKASYGSTKEWYQHSAAFDTQCVGKTAAEIAGLVTSDGKGNADVVGAGCTISVSSMVKAAVKAATVG